MKTFLVAGPEGKIAAEQLATFAYYIQNIQFRFVVTRIEGDHPVLTHRDSGKKVCAIPYMAQFKGDLVDAAKGELNRLIERVGEARVRSVLSAG